MSAIIKIRRGLSANLPTLNEGEPGFTTDTYKFYVGDGTTNHEIGSGTVWIYKNSNCTALKNQGIFADTSSSSFTLTLPSGPSIGDTIIINDLRGTFNSHALTVSCNDQKINGINTNINCDLENATYKFVFADSTSGWKYWIERLSLTYE